MDSSGTFFIADANNQRRREVNTSGTMSTVAGNLYAICHLADARRRAYVLR